MTVYLIVNQRMNFYSKQSTYWQTAGAKQRRYLHIFSICFLFMSGEYFALFVEKIFKSLGLCSGFLKLGMTAILLFS
jgi:hypothetical protein